MVCFSFKIISTYLSYLKTGFHPLVTFTRLNIYPQNHVQCRSETEVTTRCGLRVENRLQYRTAPSWRPLLGGPPFHLLSYSSFGQTPSFTFNIDVTNLYLRESDSRRSDLAFDSVRFGGVGSRWEIRLGILSYHGSQV